MSGVGVSRGEPGQSMASGRAVALGVLVVLALITVSVLIGRWSTSASSAPVRQSGAGEPAPAISAPAAVGSAGSDPAQLPWGGLLSGGGSVCLLARPC